MPTETSMLDSEAGMAWLRQFALRDQKLAADLLGVFCFASLSWLVSTPGCGLQF
jgi:hypothetical protein